MNQLLILLSILVGFTSANTLEIVQWNFTAKKTGDKTYEVYLTPTVKSSWHIYSQSTPGALPTTIIFIKHPMVILDGKTIERGKVTFSYLLTYLTTRGNTSKGKLNLYKR